MYKFACVCVFFNEDVVYDDNNNKIEVHHQNKIKIKKKTAFFFRLISIPSHVL